MIVPSDDRRAPLHLLERWEEQLNINDGNDDPPHATTMDALPHTCGAFCSVQSSNVHAEAFCDSRRESSGRPQGRSASK